MGTFNLECQGGGFKSGFHIQPMATAQYYQTQAERGHLRASLWINNICLLWQVGSHTFYYTNLDHICFSSKRSCIPSFNFKVEQCCIFEHHAECYTLMLHVCSHLTAVFLYTVCDDYESERIKKGAYFLVLSVALPEGGAVLQHGSSTTMCLSVFWISQRRRARASARQPYPSIIMTPQAAAMGNLPLSSRPELWGGTGGDGSRHPFRTDCFVYYN